MEDKTKNRTTSTVYLLGSSLKESKKESETFMQRDERQALPNNIRKNVYSLFAQ